MSHGNKSSPSLRTLCVSWGLGRSAICIALIWTAAAAPAQEALRVSTAGQDAAEARKLGMVNEKFNVQLGPVALRFQSSFAVEANDNVRLAADHEEEDLIFRPQVNALTVWQVTEKNRLSLSLGVGYAKYVNTTEFDNLFLAPGSDLSFDVYVQDFVINFHDRFSYSQDVSSDPSVSGVGSVGRFVNILGVGVTWDLNKAILSAGYDHATHLATQSEFSYQTYSSELFNASAGFQISPITLLGIQIGGGLTDYEEDVFNDNKHISGGPFLLMRASDYSSLRVSAGYVAYFFDSTGTNKLSSISGIYADLSFKQRVNAVLSHSVSAGRQLQSGTFSETTDLIYFRYDASWNVLRKISVGTSISYEHINDSGGQIEKADRYGFSLTLGRPWTEHLSSSLSYQFYIKNSDIAQRDYLQNRLVLDLNYTF